MDANDLISDGDLERAFRAMNRMRRNFAGRGHERAAVWHRLLRETDPWTEFSSFLPDADADRRRICEAIERADAALRAIEGD